MNKIKKILFNKKYLPYYIILIMTILVGHPMLNTTAIYGHDLPFHIFRIQGTTKAFLDGQIIPIVDPNVASGYGYAYNLFYGIFPTYVVGILNNIFNNWMLSYNFFLFICIYFSGLFMYKFVCHVSKKQEIGLIASLLYISFPYFLTDIYIRAALGEFMTFLFIPILFHGLYNLINDDKSKYYYITIGTVGLLLSHNLSTLMIAMFAAIYLLLNIKKVLKKEVIKKISISLGFALVISLITIGPLLEAKFSTEYDVFHNEWMSGSVENMNNERISFSRLISSNLFRQYESSNELLSGSMPFDLGFSCIISLISLIFTYNKYKNNDKKNLKQFLILGFISIFITSTFLNWKLVPNILYMFQFPWRFLLMSTFFLSIVSAYSIYKLFDKFNEKSLVLIILVCFMGIYPLTGYANYATKIDNSIFDYKYQLDNITFGSSATGSNEYFPTKMVENMDYIKNRENNALVLNGNATINDYVKNGTNITFTIKANENSLIELPLTYYKGYKEVNNFEAIETNNGLVGIKIPKGNFKINVRYSNTNIQIVSYCMSIIATITFILYIRSKKI